MPKADRTPLGESNEGDRGSDRVGCRIQVIADDHRYHITQAAMRDFEEALAQLDQTEAHQSPEMRALMRAGMESQLDDLRQQLAEFETLFDGQAGAVHDCPC